MLKAYGSCRENLIALAAKLRELDVRNGGHTAAADLLLLYASTQTWFASEREYKAGACCNIALTVLVWQHLDICSMKLRYMTQGAATWIVLVTEELEVRCCGDHHSAAPGTCRPRGC